MTKTRQGKAYAFFNSNASKQEIEEEIPYARELAQTPEKLELLLKTKVDGLGEEAEQGLIQLVKDGKWKYSIEATYPRARNYQTANELADLMNMLYNAQIIERNGLEIACKQGRAFMFRD